MSKWKCMKMLLKLNMNFIHIFSERTAIEQFRILSKTRALKTQTSSSNVALHVPIAVCRDKLKLRCYVTESNCPGNGNRWEEIAEKILQRKRRTFCNKSFCNPVWRIYTWTISSQSLESGGAVVMILFSIQWRRMVRVPMSRRTIIAGACLRARKKQFWRLRRKHSICWRHLACPTPLSWQTAAFARLNYERVCTTLAGAMQIAKKRACDHSVIHHIQDFWAVFLISYTDYG